MFLWQHIASFFHPVGCITLYTVSCLPDLQHAPRITAPAAVIHERGSPETLRDPRGFAVKFYTREGNFDMVGNNMPVSVTQPVVGVGGSRAMAEALVQAMS
jgi:hypothetical protein